MLIVSLSKRKGRKREASLLIAFWVSDWFTDVAHTSIIPAPPIVKTAPGQVVTRRYTAAASNRLATASPH
jgi:hypothetical protein